MKNIVLVFCLLILCTSCRQTITDKDIENLNGYWEIEKVDLPQGDDKTYEVNESYDFFEVKNLKGIRKKVTPQVDGTYLTNNLHESISISKKEGNYFIEYRTNHAKWTEEIIKLTYDKLVLKNTNEIEYEYKRPILFSKK